MDKSTSINGISIIICTYNGSARIGLTLEYILKLKADFPFELIIVNNASTDDTELFCERILRGTNLTYKIVLENQPGLSHARICGLRSASYDVILFCDDDNTLDEDFLQIGYSLIQKHPSIGALGGCGYPIFETDPPGWFKQYSHSYAVGPQSNIDGKLNEYPAEIYGACTLLLKKPLLDLFDAGFKSIMTGRKGNKLVSGDDVEWCYLLQLKGYEIWYDHRLRFGHLMPEGRLQWSYYLRMKEAISYGACAFLSYRCFFVQPTMHTGKFFFIWMKELVFSILIYLNNKVKSFFFKKNDLSLIILRAKMMSYFKDLNRSHRHFIQLKNFF
jgi:glycosyltransferase involved in cell wall biosynthesis